jgi:3-hydroxyacyl-[acyl-carrier-protein] dehydratase
MKPNQKFLNDLYTVKNIKEDSVNKITVRIELIGEHDIFKGHFPGNPVLPGVCALHILKELLEQYSGKDMNLAKAGTIKFLSFIDPVKNNILDYEIQMKEMENNQISCIANVRYESVVFCSFKGEFSISN